MARALAERNKRRPRINAAPFKRRVNLTPKKKNARAFNRGNTVIGIWRGIIVHSMEHWGIA